MASDSYELFLQQLNAQGSDKADGFDRRAFDGLTSEERPRVERMLLDAVQRGDNTAAEGLVLFDRTRAPELLEYALGRVPFDNGVGASVAGQLWTLTHDRRYDRELARYLQHRSASTRLTALGYLKQMPPDPAIVPEVAEVVEADASRVNRSIAASILLYWSGRIPNTDAAYRVEPSLMGQLTSEDGRTRRAAVASVMQHGGPR